MAAEVLKLIYMTVRQGREREEENTFICVNKEKMKQEGCECLSQPQEADWF